MRLVHLTKGLLNSLLTSESGLLSICPLVATSVIFLRSITPEGANKCILNNSSKLNLPKADSQVQLLIPWTDDLKASV